MKVLLKYISESLSENEREVGIRIGNHPESRHIIGIPADMKEGKVSVLLSESLMHDLIDAGWKSQANEGFYLQEFNLVVGALIEEKEKPEFPIDLSESGLGFRRTNCIQKFTRKTRRFLNGNT